MKKGVYRTIDDVLRSPWALLTARQRPAAPLTDRVLRSTKLEDSIYADLRDGDNTLDQVERNAEKKLRSFPSLARDVFQAVYSLLPRRMEEGDLSAAARKFNAPILEQLTKTEDYATLKTVCEGRELPAYEAAAEFTARLGSELDQLLEDLGGGKGTANTLEKLEASQAQAVEELAALLEVLRRESAPSELLEQAAVAAANAAQSKSRQAEAVGKLIDTTTARNKAEIATLVAVSARAAAEKAEEAATILAAWSDEPGKMEKTRENTELLERVRASKVLRKVARYLGRFREILAQGRRNSYVYGRGETYSLELGNSISRALTSELTLLATPETVPLFLRKYQRKQIKQYRRREPVYRGMGDIICCLDESGSTRGDNAEWGKAVALTLLEIASESGRRFALIHFSGAGRFQTDLFLPGQYGLEGKVRAAETFLGGGTDFATPMAEALRLMAEEGFDQADVVFLTDGECAMPADMLERLRQEQGARRFTVTGILLDQDNSSIEFSTRSASTSTALPS